MTVFSRRTIGPKPRRTRGQLIAVVVAALVLLLLIGEVISDTVNDSPEVGRRALATWAAGVEPLLASSSAMGEAVRTINGADASMTRVTLDAALTTLTSVTAANEAEFNALGIQAPSATDSALVQRVLSSRAAAAMNLARSVTSATTPSSSSQSATSSCIAAEGMIKQGDSAIATLDAVMKAISGISHQQFRKWNSYTGTLGSGGCSGLVQTLRENQALILRPALKLMAISVLPSPVQINGVPNPTTTTTSLPPHSTTTTSTTSPAFGTTTSTSSTTTTTTTTVPVTTTTLQIPPQSARSVLPPTKSVTADIVVADVGDAVVRGVMVTVQVVGAGGQVIATRSKSVPRISANSSAYLTIGPVPLQKVSGTFRLQVEASATGVASSKQVITLQRSS